MAVQFQAPPPEVRVCHESMALPNTERCTDSWKAVMVAPDVAVLLRYGVLQPLTSVKLIGLVRGPYPGYSIRTAVTGTQQRSGDGVEG